MPESIAEQQKKMIELRRALSLAQRACRQAVVFLNGQSCLDQNRVRRNLMEAAAAADRALEEPNS